ncbi:MAG TPA: hypothetical protein VN455_13585 [Methanotrichaceae archaeon]|nr:hypothetical protein [Methanotrichaceae archaeon]
MADKRNLIIILLVAVIVLLAFLAIRSMMYSPAYSPGSTNGYQPVQMGPGMMYGPGYNYNYSHGPEMMYGPGYNYSLGAGMMGNIMALYYPRAVPITSDIALRSLQSFARQYGSNVEVVDAMAFSSNYYGILRNASSGQELAEVLVDRYSGSASPEPGPNMMWNTRFGAGRAQAGGLVYDLAGANKLAENFLAGYLPGARTQDSNALPGYYTFDFGRNKIEGMLSVNAYSGQIWVHTWHGFYLGSINMTG